MPGHPKMSRVALGNDDGMGLWVLDIELACSHYDTLIL